MREERGEVRERESRSERDIPESWRERDCLRETRARGTERSGGFPKFLAIQVI